MMLATHFPLDEFERSDTALRNDWENYLPWRYAKNARRLAETLLLPVRQRLGTPVHVSSGYRCKRVNTAVNGAINSAHMTGRAADIYVLGLSAKELTAYVGKTTLPYDKLINEFGGWVHIQISKSGNAPRRLIYAAIKNDVGDTEYRREYV